MLSVDEARDRILSHVSPLAPQRFSLLAALGLVLAEDVVADVDLPPFDNSAMDGYALRWDDTLDASPESPVRLEIRGESAAGHPSDLSVGPGTAVRIMTGAALPTGATAVVRFEDVRVVDESHDDFSLRVTPITIELFAPCAEGHNVRRAGEDITSGSPVLSHGVTLGPAQLGLLAALDRTRVMAIRRPVVAVLATGDEVVPPGAELRPGQIRDSNSVLIAAMISRFGGIPRPLGIAHDTQHDIKGKICEARDCDFIVTCGGVSVGDFDVVKRVLQQEGEIDLWQVAIRPGRPMAFGFIGATPLLGLPGNPVAAAVTFSQFGGPVIKRMLGETVLLPQIMKARVETDIQSRGGRREFVRGVVWRQGDDLVVRPVSRQGSGSLGGLALANCYIVCRESIDHVPAGSTVEIEMIDPENPFAETSRA